MSENNDILGNYLDDEPKKAEKPVEQPDKPEIPKTVKVNRYDWNRYLMEFLEGGFNSIAEYAKWNQRKKEMGEIRPGMDSVKIKARKDKWLDKKKSMQDEWMEDLTGKGTPFSQNMSEKLEEHLNAKKEIIESQTKLTNALVSLVETIANNPEHLNIKANFSDLINDAMRALNMRTKEMDLKPTQVAVNQSGGVIEIDSRRKQLEEAEADELGDLEKKQKKMNKSLRRKLGYQDEIVVEAEVVEDEDEN